VEIENRSRPPVCSKADGNIARHDRINTRTAEPIIILRQAVIKGHGCRPAYRF